MKATEALEQQHRAVEDLFEEFEQATLGSRAASSTLLAARGEDEAAERFGAR